MSKKMITLCVGLPGHELESSGQTDTKKYGYSSRAAISKASNNPINN
jgi:hypothetical protein